MIVMIININLIVKSQVYINGFAKYLLNQKNFEFGFPLNGRQNFKLKYVLFLLEVNYCDPLEIHDFIFV